MGTTLTIRTDDSLRKALTDRAEALGIGVSALVRSILQEAMSQRSLGDRTAALRGRLELPTDPSEPLRARLRKRNWRR